MAGIGLKWGRFTYVLILFLAGITVLVFFLWSRGWSPQWLLILLPFVLLALPLQQAALYLIVLTFINVLEWPVLLTRGTSQWLYLTVPIRTAVFILLLVSLTQGLWRGPADALRETARTVMRLRYGSRGEDAR